MAYERNVTMNVPRVAPRSVSPTEILPFLLECQNVQSEQTAQQNEVLCFIVLPQSIWLAKAPQLSTVVAFALAYVQYCTVGEGKMLGMLGNGEGSCRRPAFISLLRRRLILMSMSSSPHKSLQMCTPSRAMSTETILFPLPILRDVPPVSCTELRPLRRHDRRTRQ